MRPLVTALLAAGLGFAQFQELATTTGGSRVYLSSNFRLRGSAESLASKIFMIDAEGAHLIAEEGDSANLYAPSVAGDGSVLAYYARRFCNSGSTCVYDEQSAPRIYPAIPAFSAADMGGAVISRNGRFVALYSTTGLISFGYAPTVIDLLTGRRVKLPPFVTSVPVVSSNGALLAYVISPSGRGLALVDLAGQITIIAADAVGSAGMSDDGSVIVYSRADYGLAVRDALGNTAILFLGGNRVVDPVVSGDGQSIVYRTTVGNAQQLFFVHADGSGLRQLTTEAAGIATDTLSGDGKVAYAVTASGAIVRIDTQTGSIKQLVGPAPRIRSFTGGHAPGSVILVDGSGLSGTGVTIAGLPAPVVFSSPERIDFQIPWETPVETQPVAPVPTRTALALPGGDPYFDAAFPFPVYALDPRAVQLGPSDPRTNYIPVAVHQDGLRVVTLALPARAGEIVTIYATGLGPVSPPVADGAAASASPLSLLTTPLKFSFVPGSRVTGNFPGFPLPAQVQFAGLAPGFVGLYQINVVVPDVAIPSVALAATAEGRGLLFLGDIALAQP